MSNNWLKYLVAISAILIAGSAAYFSVTGLGVLFSGAAIAVMVMASSLEFAKLVTATYLKQKWDEIRGFNKWYLAFAVTVLMLITSAGIFGYLSNAFQQQNLKLNQVQREISVWENKIKGNNDQIATITTQLNGLQSNQGTILEKGKVNSRLLRSVDNRDKQVNKLTDKINVLQDSIIAYNGKINEIKNDNIDIEREVGGFRFVAESFGVELNSVVKFFIILIVIVFDPLAIALVIALNQLIMVKKKDEDEVSSKPEELKDFVDETTRIHLSDDDLKKLEEVLLNPLPPNEKLKEAAQRYSDEVREKHTHIDDFIVEPTQEERHEILTEMMKNDQELGLYNEPFDNPMIKESESTVLSERLAKMDEELKLQEEEYDDDISDWDVTLMDGLEDEEPFFTEEELENILREEPTIEEEEQNFSTIEPITENISQEEEFLIPVNESVENEPEFIVEGTQLTDDMLKILDDAQSESFGEDPTIPFSDEFIEDAINEFNQESLEDELEEEIPEPIITPEEVDKNGIDIKQLNEALEEVNREIDETSPIKGDEKKN
jgi:hypothetical protein